jgi:glycosyltransferase involved in cell wall biosynthesis
MSVLTIGIIVKNEMKNLPGCLDALEPLRAAVDCTLAITDTGSTDGTEELAKERSDRFLSFEWNDDFSAARNTTLRGINSEWYMYIDADEHCTDPAPIIEFFSSGEYKKYDNATIIIRNTLADGSVNEFNPTRLVKTVPGMKFIGAIHEHLNVPYNKTANLTAVFNHGGYGRDVIAEKEMRNMKLLKKELENTTDPYLRARQLFQLGETVFKYLPADAVAYWEEAVTLPAKTAYNRFLRFCVLARLEMFYFCNNEFDKVLETHERYAAMRKEQKNFPEIIYTDIEDVYYTALAAEQRALAKAQVETEAGTKAQADSEKNDTETAFTAFEEYFKFYNIYHADRARFIQDNGVYPAVNVSQKSHDKAVAAFTRLCIKDGRFTDALGFLPNAGVSAADTLFVMDSANDFTRMESTAKLPDAFGAVKSYLSRAVNKIALADNADKVFAKLAPNEYKGDFAAISRYLQIPFDCQVESLDAKKSVIEYLTGTENPDEIADLAILTADYTGNVYRVNDPDFYSPFIKAALKTLQDEKTVSN